MGSFREFREARELQAFAQGYNQLCESLIHVDFNEWWSKEALPILIERSILLESEEDLLNEFLGGIKNWWNGGGQKAPAQDIEAPQAFQQHDQKYRDQEAQRAKKLSSFQGQMDGLASDIKGRFGQAMQSFMKAVQDDAKRQNNPHMYEIASRFHKKVMAAAQPAIDSFAIKAQYGKGNDYSQFNNERGAMQKSQQDAMKQNLMGKHGNDLKAKQGYGTSQEIGNMRQAAKQGYDPFNKNWNDQPQAPPTVGGQVARPKRNRAPAQQPQGVPPQS